MFSKPEKVDDLYKLMLEIQQGSQIVTGNLRLARKITQQYDTFIADQDKYVWTSAHVVPWAIWVFQNWEEAVIQGNIPAPGLLLSPEQEFLVWKQIISESEHGGGLLRINATAKKVQSAWDLLNAWNVKLTQEDVLGNLDSEIFLQWVEQFKEQCRLNDWLSKSLMIDQLIKVNNDIGNQKQIIFLGFDEFSPQQQQFITGLNSNCCWWDYAPKHLNHNVVRLACNDYRDEINCLSHWLRQQLERRSQQDSQSNYQIAVIVPELAKYREVLLHALNLTLEPSNLHPTNTAQSDSYNISLGKPLVDYPLIRTAFLLLDIFQPRPVIRPSMESISQLLRSPFLAGWEIEMHQRALLDRELRKKRQDKLSLNSLLYKASPILKKKLSHTRELLDNLIPKASCKIWVKQFDQILKTIGWAQGRSLNSEEYQVLEAWNKLLAVMSTMTVVADEIDASNALSILQNLAAESLFQVQTKNSSIQIMGLYEATGLHFDAMWIMGLHDALWPAKATPDNFIPLTIQRQLNMPHSSARRELDVAKVMTHRLIHSAEQVIVSYPCLGEQSEELDVSPLIEPLPLINKQNLDLTCFASWADEVAGSSQLQHLENDQAPPVIEQKVSGGSGLFKYQAACPFRAFAEFRLKARAFEKSEPGLDALQRGGIVHKALELAWIEIKDHQQLINLQQSHQLEPLLQRVIESALCDLQEEYQQTMGIRFIHIEIERIKIQLLKWFELEAQRAPFAIDRLEHQLQSEINGILVDIVIDRIDILPDNRRVLIDYKTGGVRPSQWFGYRPEEPQLPLYSSMVKDNKAAVLFGQLKTGDIVFKGIVADPDLIPNLPPKRGDRLIKEAAERWDEILQEWLLMLQKLAGDFRQGKADVDPKDENQTCQYCQLSTLCRIDELNASKTAEEQDK